MNGRRELRDEVIRLRADIAALAQRVEDTARSQPTKYDLSQETARLRNEMPATARNEAERVLDKVEPRLALVEQASGTTTAGAESRSESRADLRANIAMAAAFLSGIASVVLLLTR